MESILFLAHTESDGSLGKPALEALAAAKTLALTLADAKLAAGLVGGQVQRAADSIAVERRGPVPGRGRALTSRNPATRAMLPPSKRSARPPRQPSSSPRQPRVGTVWLQAPPSAWAEVWTPTLPELP